MKTNDEIVSIGDFIDEKSGKQTLSFCRIYYVCFSDAYGFIVQDDQSDHRYFKFDEFDKYFITL